MLPEEKGDVALDEIAVQVGVVFMHLDTIPKVHAMADPTAQPTAYRSLPAASCISARFWSRVARLPIRPMAPLSLPCWSAPLIRRIRWQVV